MAEDAPGDRSVPRGPRWVPTGPSELPTDPQGEPIDAARFDLRRWDPGVPLLLLPVRLETKYARRDGGGELRIRIIPDAVSVQSAAPASEREIEEATDFWTAYHGATGADERAAVWRQFVGRLGTNRAGYVARLTRPVAVAGAGGSLTFPTIAADAPTPGIMSLLPERWLAFGWVGETLAFQQFGDPVTGPLAVSPDPTAPVTEVGRSGLRIDPATSWLFDYDEAVERGMAITVPLTGVAAKAADGVSTLVVVGIDATQRVRETAKELAGLLDDHSRAAGLAFVPQGTPTNNTSDVRSGYRREESELADLEQRALGSYVAHDDDNASRFARLLGLADAEPFGRLAFGADREFARSRDMRVALFEAVLGTYVRDLLATHAIDDDALTDRLASTVIGALRTWFETWVTGGAPVPTIRVGDQPYGILPVMPRSSVAPSSDVAQRIVDVVALLSEEWRHAVASVPVLDHDATDSLGATPAEADAAARDLVASVLSNNPHPRRVSLRTASDWSDQPRPELEPARVAGRAAAARATVSQQVGSEEWSYPIMMPITGGVRWEYLDALDRLSGMATTLGPVYDAVLQAVVPGRPDIDTGPILDRPIDGGRTGEPAAREVETGPATEADIRDIEQQIEVWAQTDIAIDEPGAINHEFGDILVVLHEFVRDVLEQLERHELRQRPLRWLDVPGLDGVLGRDDLQLLLTKFGTLERIVRRALVVEADPVAGVTAQQYLDQLSDAARGGGRPVGSGRTGPPEVPGTGPIDVDLPGGGVPPLLPQEFRDDPPLLYQLVNATLLSAPGSTGLADALARLADVAPEPLDWLVRETLGLGTHRLDAWHTSLASERLAAMRDGTAEGLYVGHYGFGLDLRRADARVSHGFIHAPSLAHAASAAVLRSGWLARGSDAQDSPAAVDLASARVREADWLLSGVRQGQDLGDLLGASFERGLHDAGLDVAIRPIRQAVIAANGLAESSLDVPVDAIELLDVSRSGGLAATIADLGLRAEKDRDLLAELDGIESAFDAVDDVLTFESVHQLVVGNLDRAAAVLDGSGPNGGRPPELHGVRTPRGALTIDVRALVLLDAESTSASGWRGGTRELFDPALEAWVAAMLPSPGDVGWVATTAEGGRVELRLDQLAVSALDACALASDDPTTLTPGLRRLAELARPKITLVSHAPADPGDAPLSLAELQVLAVELRRLVHESTAADERAVLPADQALAPVEGAPRPDLAAADGLDALLSAFDAVRDAASWADLVVDVSETLARIDLVPSPTADIVEDFASLEARIRRRRRAAGAVEQIDTWDGMRERIAALAGTAVPFLAPFVLPADGGIVLSDDLATPDAVDDWLDLVASVHPNLGRLGRAIDVSGFLGQSPSALVAVQAPLLEGDPWAAVDRPPAGTGGRITGAVLTHGTVAAGRSIVGLVVDRWSERIPNADQVTGVAFHFDAPSSEAPQTMLLAVPPEGNRWTTELVLDAVLETIEWMQLRAVAPDDLGDFGHALPTTMVPGQLDGAAIVGVGS